jgi:hypothetical protein
MASKFQIPIAFKSDPRGLQQAEGALAGFGKKLAGIGAAVAGAFAVRAVFNFGKEAILAAEAVATANARLGAIAKATQVFGAETEKVTARLVKFAEAQEMVVAVDAEVIKGVQAQLLSFKKLSASAGEVGGVFDRVTKAAFDMAAAGFGSAESNAIALGKAFEDPIRGLTALRRSGTVFTEEQQKLIKTLVDSGDLLGAQTIILEELESQYGGTAEATANWSDKLNLAFDNVKESVGKALTPAFERFAKFLIEQVIPPLTKFFEDDFPVMLSKFGAMASGLGEALAPIGKALRDAFNVPSNVSLLEHLLDSIAKLPDNKVFMQLVDSIVQLTPSLLQLLPPLTELVLNLMPLLIELVPILTGLVKLLAEIISGIAQGFSRMNDEMAGVFGTAESGLSPIQTISKAFSDFDAAVLRVRDSLRAAWNALRDFLNLQASGNRIPGVPSLNLPRRAVGGPVQADRSFLVGERGPELFTPGAGGFITPNNRLGGNSGTTYNITVNAGMGVGNGAQLGEAIVSAIKRYERVSGPVFASA